MVQCTITEGDYRPLRTVDFTYPGAGAAICGNPVRGGLEVAAITEGTPWEKAGLRVGDKVVAINGEAMDSQEKLRTLLRRNLVSDDGLTVRFLRDGKAHEVWLDSAW
jgi:S1-C subfamily serine protease